MKSNIKQRIFLFNVFNIIAVVLVITFVSGALYKKMITEKALLFQNRETTLVSNNINLLVNTVNDYVNTVCVDTTLQNILRDFDATANTLTEQYNIERQLLQTIYSKTALSSYIDSIAIITNNDTIIALDSYPQEGFQTLITSDFPDLNELNKKVSWYGPVRLENNAGKMNNVFIVAKPIYDAYSPQLLGYIFALVNEKDFSKFYDDNIDEPIELYIVNKNSEIISTLDKNLLYQNISSLERAKYVTTEKEIDDTDWKVVNYIPEQYLTSGMEKIIFSLIAIGIVTIIIFFFWSYRTANIISRPIYQLASAMKNCDLLVTNERMEDSNSLEELNLLNHRFNQMIDRIKELLIQIETVNKQKRKYEFSLLQAQIQPHFLYNSLGTIVSLIGISMNKEAMEYTKNLGTFYRISLSDGKEIITLSQELELIKSYLYMQQIRYIDKMEYTIEENSEIGQCLIPKLTLQPIVENAIYHGIKPARKKSLLSIKCTKAEGDIFIVIYDNGVGIPEETLPLLLKTPKEQFTYSFGLPSLNHRLKLFFGEEYGISIRSEYGCFTEITVKIPIEVQHVKNIDH